MSEEEFTLRLQPRGKPVPNLPAELPIASHVSVDELYSAVSKLTGHPTYRLRITKSDSSHLKPSSSSLAESKLYDQSQVFVKDLGFQVGWQFVFVVEYLGPLLIHPAFFLLRRYIYSVYPPLWQWTDSPLTTPPTKTQITLLTMVVLHYTKRELETLFIHRFSAATMPLFPLIRNWAYYWTLGGIFLAYFLYMPTQWESPDYYYYPGIAVWIFAEVSNFHTHMTLRNLRRPGTKDRGIPTGYGFNIVTCPNYMFEILGWFAVAAITGWSIPALVFWGAGVYIQTLWAWQKERRYRKEFGDKYKKKRWGTIPFIL